MPPLVPISGKKMASILTRLGFALLRVRGSHYFYYNAVSGKTTTIPIHRNEVLGKGILKEILRDIELDIEEYDKVRKSC